MIYTTDELERMLNYDGPWSGQMARSLARQLLSALQKIERMEKSKSE